MAVIMLIAGNGRIMGRLTLSRPILAVGWLATLIMLAAKHRFLRALKAFRRSRRERLSGIWAERVRAEPGLTLVVLSPGSSVSAVEEAPLPRFLPIKALVAAAVAAITAMPVLAQQSAQGPATTPPASTAAESPRPPSASPPSATGVVTTTNNPNLAVATLKLANGVRASKIIGQTVQNDQNQRVGKVEDLIVTSGDRITIAIVSVGGFLGMGDKLVAVPWEQLRAEGDHLVLPGATKETMSGAPNFQN